MENLITSFIMKCEMVIDVHHYEGFVWKLLPKKKLNLKKNSWPLCFYTFKYLMKNTKNWYCHHSWTLFSVICYTSDIYSNDSGHPWKVYCPILFSSPFLTEKFRTFAYELMCERYQNLKKYVWMNLYSFLALTTFLSISCLYQFALNHFLLRLTQFCYQHFFFMPL